MIKEITHTRSDITKTLTLTLLAGVAVFLASASLAYADSDHGKRKDKDNGLVRYHYDVPQTRHDLDQDRYMAIRIRNDDRKVLHGYLEDHYQKSCPPGLAKKHNGCLPPGQAKKRYVVGHYLPDYVHFEPVPSHILRKLHPAPVGTQYVLVDTDVLLIGEATKKIIDAVTLLSAVKN